MMKGIRHIFVIVALLLSASSLAQGGGDIQHEIAIREIEVLGHRPMKEIGAQQTKFDSIVLRENVALSMADILSYSSPIFVKNFGRATLSTVSFRGTSPSHTQVTWNGMKINSPMLGMVDFSMIPSYFIDKATLLHGTSSVSESGGGLGGAVQLATAPANEKGFNLQYVQGAGSFVTFDEFLRMTYGNDRIQGTTRFVCSTSRNNYKFRNHDKKENIYDDNHNIIGQYYPVERNRSGAFRDIHLLQELYYNNLKGDRFGVNLWYVDSSRELPMLTTDYGEAMDFENLQRERTFRSLVSWNHIRSSWKAGVKAGYIYSWMAYDYKRDVGSSLMSVMTRSRSNINTVYISAEGEYYISNKWLFTANISLHQHFVRSSDRNISAASKDGIVGYNKSRAELSMVASAKWRPVDRIGLSFTLREEMYGGKWIPVIPALFLEGVVSRKGNLTAKASVSRNYRFPTLNDLYFLPGGNPDLKSEKGFTYDLGLSFMTGKKERYTLSGSATWFYSKIDNWILWLPTIKGFFTPRNVKTVKAYGVELKLNGVFQLASDWKLSSDANFSWTPSINIGDPVSEADQSVGKQLPYTPKYSATLSVGLTYRSWSVLYKWCYYSRRFTQSSNEDTLTGYLPPYFMSNLSLEKQFSFKWADLSLKGTINNLLNEEYLSVLSRPMPGINFEIFVGIRPKWGKKR